MNTNNEPEKATQAPIATPAAGETATGVSETETMSKPPPTSVAGKVVGWAALIIALGAIAGGFWLWQQLERQQSGLNTALRQVQDQQTRSSALTEQLHALDGQLGSQQDNIDRLSAEMADIARQNHRLEETLAALHQQLNRNPKIGWLIAEAGYLLTVANQQLQLTGDIDTSIAALRNADQRLRESGDPSLLEVRGAIADEISRLQSIVPVDIAGAALTLTSMQMRVGQLSLAGTSEKGRPQPPPVDSLAQTTGGWRGALDNAWQALKGLVVIRRRGEDAQGAPLLTPDQRALLYQNLRLKLEGARLSLIEKDVATFRQSVKSARHWLVDYFDADGKRAALEETLDELLLLDINPELPDISGSSALLRQWQRQQAQDLSNRNHPE